MISIPIPFIIDVRTGRIQLTPSKTDTNNRVTLLVILQGGMNIFKKNCLPFSFG